MPEFKIDYKDSAKPSEYVTAASKRRCLWLFLQCNPKVKSADITATEIDNSEPAAKRGAGTVKGKKS